jgi:ribonuclease HI
MKYYAVRKGRKTGIFNLWDECKDSVNKFSGAEFMSFKNKIDAEKYLKIFNSPPLIPIEEEEEEEEGIFVYTDGGCSNNGYKNAIAGIGVYFGEGDPRNVSRRITSLRGKSTNNTAEVKAILEAYKILKKEISSGERIIIVSDSVYAIRAATFYGEKIKEDKPNYKLVKKIHSLFKGKENINFIHVEAHENKPKIRLYDSKKDIFFNHKDRDDKHSKGNDMADELASNSLI